LKDESRLCATAFGIPRNASAAWLIEPRDHPQERRFSASRRPQHRKELSSVDAQVHPGDNGYAVFEDTPHTLQV